MPMTRDALVRDLDHVLESHRFRDYGPNGLQVEGRSTVAVLATACSASLAACRAAVAAGADALLVHHGLFWGRCEPLVGPLRARVAVLIGGDVSLLAYHLPLDAHPEFGNNAVILHALSAGTVVPFAEHRGSPVGLMGDLPEALPAVELARRIQGIVTHEVLHCPGADRPLRRIGVVTGGGQGHLLEAAAAGCDALITGEASEQSWHEAAEGGCHLFACGHHASEDLAVHGLGEMLARRHDLRHVPMHLINPV